MESSEEEDDFPTHEWITPQSSITAIYQSDTEKGIRKICTELLDLKDAVENLCGDMQSKYLAFLRLSEEVIEVEQEIIELQKHVSAQGILAQDLISGVCHELDIWNKWNNETSNAHEDIQVSEMKNLSISELEDVKVTFLETVDVLLTEHKVEEALLAFDAEEKRLAESNSTSESPSAEVSSYMSALSERKAVLVNQLVDICEQSSVCNVELKTALTGLVKLGKGSLGHQLLLKAYGSQLQKKIEAFLPLCSIYLETYPATLSQLVFSSILLVKRESASIFGDAPTYMNRIVQWSECEIESLVHLVKENAPSSDSASVLHSASICLQASLGHCSILESEGMKFSKLLMVLLLPYVEEVIDMNFSQARRRVLDLATDDDTMLFSTETGSPLSAAATSNIVATSTGKKFMCIVADILEQLTPMAILHFGGVILNKILQVFDKYVEMLIKALPGPSEDDALTGYKETIGFRAETDSQQLALLGTAFTVADELLPIAVSRIFTLQTDNNEGSNRTTGPIAISTVEYKDWRRHLQHSLDKLRDHFCMQYILTFIYSREGNARLDALIYLNGKGDDLFWDSDPLPSLPFQALFARLQQLASVAGDVLLGKEKIQKVLLSRLTETVVMWLSDEQEFWDVFEDESVQLQPSGLQQLILDMHFIVEIAVCGGYSSRNVQQIVSAIITRAIGTFSARGVDPQSALPEDEWFVDTAKAAISKLLLGTSGSEASEPDEHIIIHDGISDSDETPSSLSTLHSVDSFASANMEETESPVYFTDPET